MHIKNRESFHAKTLDPFIDFSFLFHLIGYCGTTQTHFTKPIPQEGWYWSFLGPFFSATPKKSIAS